MSSHEGTFREKYRKDDSRIYIRMDGELKTKIKIVAAKEHKTMSEIANEAFLDYFNKHKEYNSL